MRCRLSPSIRSGRIARGWGATCLGWHGNTVVAMGTRMDVVNLPPASMLTADMVPDNPGVWLFHCHVNDHLAAGMTTRFRVTT